MKTIKLGELCDINPKDALPDKGTLVSFIPMQRVSETGQVDATETRQSEEVTKGFSSFREGDILMAKITPCMENGKGGIAKGLCNGIGYGSTEFHVIRPTSPLVRTEWIYYYTTYPRFRKLCEQNMTGSAGQKRVPKSYLLGCPIPVPNLNTQDKVIHSLRSLRSIIEHRRAQLAKLDELVKCRFVEMFGDCRSNPKQWGTKKLDEIASVGSSKRVFVEELIDGGIPFYRGTEVGALAEGQNITPELFISESHYRELCKASGKPVKGDLLMPSICPDGRIWIVDSDSPFYFKDGRVLWVHDIHENFNPIFLQYSLKDRIISDYASIASGTTFAELKIFTLKSCKIFDVPLPLQDSFAIFVRHIDKLRISVQAALEKAQTLFDSLMQEYFG